MDQSEVHSLPAGWVCRGYGSAKCAESNQCSRCPQHSAARNTVTTQLYTTTMHAQTKTFHLSFKFIAASGAWEMTSSVTVAHPRSRLFLQGRFHNTRFANVSKVCRKQTQPWSWEVTSFAISAYLIAQCTAVSARWWKTCFADIFHSKTSPTLLGHEKWDHFEWVTTFPGKR